MKVKRLTNVYTKDKLFIYIVYTMEAAFCFYCTMSTVAVDATSKVNTIAIPKK